MLAKRGVHVAEDDAELFEVFAVSVIHHFRFVLGGDTSEVFALSFWDPELFVGVLDGLGDIVPVILHRFGWLDVIEDVVEVDLGHVAAPLGHWALLEALVGLQTEVAHPRRLSLHPRHLVDDVGVQALLWLVQIVFRVGPSKLVLAEVDTDVCCAHENPFKPLLPEDTATCSTA